MTGRPAGSRLRLPLDHNFPEPILKSLDAFMPDVELIPIRRIHPRLPELGDRPLILTLSKLGYTALITNNYKMLRNPLELAAVLHTNLNVVAIEGVGHDPLRATGGLLLDLPTIIKRLDPSKAQIFRIKPRGPQPIDAWKMMNELAQQMGVNPKELRADVRVTSEEAEADYLA